MNKANLKAYAPQARRDFIAAVTARANLLGVSVNSIAPSAQRGDIAIIEGREWPAKVTVQRDKLIARIKKDGFEQTIESVAYTWFNRFAALRYMELHECLDHGWRVLSSRDGGLPEILRHAADAKLSGLDQVKARDMQLAGNQDNELYKMLLVAQCNELSRTMPFLFEHIDDETELLLPENLLRTDSIIAKLVAAVPDEEWEEVEVIGWLYQFYISEKKDQVIGKVVKSEDIPAATQLFTPNWIVQYLVQNSVGRLWLMANPASTLKSQWTYYVEPAEQTPEVQAQLDDLIQGRMTEDGGSLNPESITVLDPACGSGHILVEAYELLKAIYLERGYRLRDIPRLILEKNLYGLDIDDRAAQLAGFALMMKARADDRRLFDGTLKLNVMALQESEGIDDDALANTVFDAAIAIEGGDALPSDQLFGGGQLATQHSSGLNPNDLRELIQFFGHAKTFGSLLIVPDLLAAKLGNLAAIVQQVQEKGNSLAQSYASQICEHYLLPALTLAKRYDAVVANPPYMGGKGMNAELKDFASKKFPESKPDVFAMFMQRCQDFGKSTAGLGFVTPYVWMFISSYEGIREKLVNNATIQTLIQLEYNAFEPACVPVCCFVVGKKHVANYTGSYIKLSDFKGHESQAPKTLEAIKDPSCGWFYTAKPDDFRKIPGSPIAYWVSETIRRVFSNSSSMAEVSQPKQGLATGDNDQFVRFWYEVDFSRLGIDLKDGAAAQASGKRWFPHQKGGSFRKWYGNEECVVNWENDGRSLRNFKDSNGKLRSRPQGIDFYFQECISWSDVTSSSNSFRWHDHGFIPNVIAPVVYRKNIDLRILLLVANNVFFNHIIKALNPTLHFHIGYFSNLPFPQKLASCDLSVADDLIEIARDDWNSYENSWNFKGLPWIDIGSSVQRVELDWLAWRNRKNLDFNRMIELETKNNQLFINLYELGNELEAAVPRGEITLVDADREKDSQRLISYAIGCMMGRYSLGELGLIYAHAGNAGFDATRYPTFPADADGIIPMTEEFWFADDAANRVREFLIAVWGAETLDENMAWLAESLGSKANETPEETIRRYVSASFYKDHLQTYKKRPIYWLFSSGKQGAFQALVYLHRYNEGTLSRMRAEYVVPLTAKIAARIEFLTKDADLSSSAAARGKIQKQIEVLRKKQAELLTYDERLRHYADMRIQLDLDDGVKVNYGKFGDLLAEVKAVTGGTGDD